MFYAINDNNERVSALAAKDLPRVQYHCPICEQTVRLRAGTQRVSHYAHISNKECDSFAHEMTPWHLGWQSKFLEAEREVVLESDDERHRADVLHNGIAIEFQHSPISETEFWRRSVFYTNAARHLLWVFDERSRFEKGIIEQLEDVGSGKGYCWHGHRPTFRGYHPEFHRRVTLVLQFGGTDDGDNISLCEVTHVDGVPLFSKFESVGSRLGELSLREWIDSVLIPKLELAAVPTLPIVPNIVTHRRKKGKECGETEAEEGESATAFPAPEPPPPQEEPPAATSSFEQQIDARPEGPRQVFPPDKCPECGADMVLRPGEWVDKIGGFGRTKLEPFWGCSEWAFTRCPGKRTAVPPPCPRCGSTMEAKKSHYGNRKAYWSCPVCGYYQSAVLKP